MTVAAVLETHDHAPTSQFPMKQTWKQEKVYSKHLVFKPVTEMFPYKPQNQLKSIIKYALEVILFFSPDSLKLDPTWASKVSECT